MRPYADWIMRPLPAGINQGDTLGPFAQEVTVTLPDYPAIPPVVISGPANHLIIVRGGDDGTNYFNTGASYWP